MNGIHDLGGMHGFGCVCVEENEPVFHAPWEGRVFALTAVAGGIGVANSDSFRHAIERLHPLLYLSAGYYGRWLAALETLFAESAVVTREELDARLRGEQRTVAPVPATALSGRAQPGAHRHIDTPPRFAIGQAVCTRNIHPSGHTRLPRYVRGKRGVVVRVHPAWVFPDTNAHGLGEHPQYVYAVRFDAEEIWGTAAEPHTAVHVDCFESYLEPRPQP